MAGYSSRIFVQNKSFFSARHHNVPVTYHKNFKSSPIYSKKKRNVVLHRIYGVLREFQAVVVEAKSREKRETVLEPKPRSLDESKRERERASLVSLVRALYVLLTGPIGCLLN